MLYSRPIHRARRPGRCTRGHRTLRLPLIHVPKPIVSSTMLDFFGRFFYLPFFLPFRFVSFPSISSLSNDVLQRYTVFCLALLDFHLLPSSLNLFYNSLCDVQWVIDNSGFFHFRKLQDRGRRLKWN